MEARNRTTVIALPRLSVATGIIGPRAPSSRRSRMRRVGVIARRYRTRFCSTGATLWVVSQTITQRELRNDSGEIMRRLDQGETFVVTRRGVPVGELIPIRRRVFATREHVVEVFANAAGVDGDRFRAELDRHIDQDTTPRG
jgi:prevent-host-death family protein